LSNFEPGLPHAVGAVTETVDPALAEIDRLDTLERLRLMNSLDQGVAAAVSTEIPAIAAVVRHVAESFRRGGRLIYVGAGTSGRLGVLDAVECPPTFGVDPGLVQAIIAGGERAMFRAVEGAEDSAEMGKLAVVEAGVSEADTVVGISASGQAPFVVAAVREANRRGAATAAVTNNRPSAIEAVAGITIAAIVGPEVIAGSTRLKSGTAQKMILNMISTGAMIEIGKTYGNLMVDLKATNAKLKDRAQRIVTQVTGADPAAALAALARAEGSAKLAILLLESGLPVPDAKELLSRSGGFLRIALQSL
jgi:N-acetylmuramic acid 6-phosphate etherase